MSYTKKILTGSAFVFSSTFISAFLGYLLRLLLARKFSVAEYGLIYAVVALFGLFGIFANLGLQSALTKYIAEFNVKKKYQKIKNSLLITFASHLIIVTFFGAIFFIFSKNISLKYLGTTEPYVLIILYTIYFMLNPLLNVLKAAFRGFYKMNYYSLLESFQPLFILIATVILLLLGLRIESFFIAHAMYAIITVIIFYFIFLKRVFPRLSNLKNEFDKKLTIKLYRFGIPIFLVGVLGIFLGRLNTFFLTIFRSLEEVGLYNVAYPTARAAWRISSAFIIVLLPLASEMWAKKDIIKLRKTIDKLYTYSILLVFPATVLFLIFPDFVINIMFGEKFISAALTLKLFSLGMIIIVLAKINTAILPGIGRPKDVATLTIGAGLINLILNLILIPSFGIEGAALATISSFVFLFIFSTVRINKFVKVKLNWKKYFKLFIGCLSIIIVASITKSFLQLNIWFEVTIIVVISAILYLALIFIFKIVTITEITNLLKSYK